MVAPYGIGLANLPEEQRAQQTAQAYGSTSPAATGVAPLPDVQPGLKPDEFAPPSWSDNPVGRIGFVLQSMAAGMNGQELPIERLRRQQREAQAQQLQKLNAAIGVVEHLQSIEDPTQRQQLATQIAPSLQAAGLDASILKPLQEMPPDQFDNFKTMLAGDEGTAQTLWKIGGGTLKGAMAAASSDLGKNLIEESARSTLGAKLADMQSQIEQHGEGDMLKRAWQDHVLTMGELEQINATAKILSPTEMRILRDDPGLQQSIGITPQKIIDTEMAADAQARASARYRERPETYSQFTDEQGRVWQVSSRGKRDLLDKGAAGGDGRSNAQAWAEISQLAQIAQKRPLTPEEELQRKTLAAQLSQVTSSDASGTQVVDPTQNLFGAPPAAPVQGGTMPTDMTAPPPAPALPSGQPAITTVVPPKLKTMPDPVLERVRGGVEALDQLNIMEKNLAATGVIIGPLAKMAGRAGLNQQANDFETANNQYRLSSQAMIKGIPSDADVALNSLTIANSGASEQANRSRIALARRVNTDLLIGTLAYYKAQGYALPEFYVERAKQVGVDVSAIKAWDGKGDPLAQGMKTAWEAMPLPDLLAVDASHLSKDSAALLASVIRSKSGKK